MQLVLTEIKVIHPNSWKLPWFNSERLWWVSFLVISSRNDQALKKRHFVIFSFANSETRLSLPKFQIRNTHWFFFFLLLSSLHCTIYIMGAVLDTGHLHSQPNKWLDTAWGVLGCEVSPLLTVPVKSLGFVCSVFLDPGHLLWPVFMSPCCLGP